MRKSEMIELIHSLHHREGTDSTTIHSIILDILGYDKANDEVGREINAFVNQAFSECNEEVLECFREQENNPELYKSTQLDTIMHTVLPDNVIDITGYFN